MLTETELQALTDEEVAALADATSAELDRRRDIQHLPELIEKLTQRYTKAKGPKWDELPAAVQAYKDRNPNTGSPHTDSSVWGTLVIDQDFTEDAPLGQFDTVYPGWAGYDGWPDTSQSGTYNSDLTVSVSGGVLDKHVRSINGSPTVAAITPPINGSWAVGQLYGRYEVRFRADLVPGYKMAWLLWPDSDNWVEGEIDFPEAPLGGEIWGFSHSVTGDPSQNVLAAGTGATTLDWHTAVIEWTPSRVAFFLDGVLVQETTDPAGIPTVPMHWVLQTETSLDGVVPAESSGHVQIDHVRAWDYIGPTGA